MPHLPRSESPKYAYISRSESLGTCTKRLEDLVHLYLWCDTLSCIIYSWVGLPPSPVSFLMQLKYKVRFFGSPALSGDYPCCTCIPRQFSLISCIFQVQYSAASAVILSYTGFHCPLRQVFLVKLHFHLYLPVELVFGWFLLVYLVSRATVFHGETPQRTCTSKWDFLLTLNCQLFRIFPGYCVKILWHK